MKTLGPVQKLRALSATRDSSREFKIQYEKVQSLKETCLHFRLFLAKLGIIKFTQSMIDSNLFIDRYKV